MEEQAIPADDARYYCEYRNHPTDQALQLIEVYDAETDESDYFYACEDCYNERREN